MLSLRKHFGTAGLLVAVVALVAALGGSAVAANSGDGATASAKNNRKGGNNVNKLIKREARKFSKVFSQRFSKRFPGPVGPQGFPGLPGAPGEDGDDGDDGSDGSDGAPGKDGKSVEVTGTAPGCGDGGATVQVEGEPGTAEEVCNGQTGFTAFLPEGETQTGTFVMGKVEAFIPRVGSISFSIPLELPLEEENVHAVSKSEVDGEETPAVCEDAGHAGTASAANPEAAPGHLCVFSESGQKPIIAKPGSSFGEVGAGVSGALLGLATDNYAAGSWAVTAP